MSVTKFDVWMIWAALCASLTIVFVLATVVSDLFFYAAGGAAMAYLAYRFRQWRGYKKFADQVEKELHEHTNN